MDEPARLRVRFVGTGDAFGSGGRLQTCFHVASSRSTFLVDCGATSLGALKAAGLDPSEIDTVVITHLHGDHFGGLPFLVLDAQFAKRTAPLTLAGPPGLEERLSRAMEVFFPGSTQAKRRFDLIVRELPEGETTTLGPLEVTPFEVKHASGAPAYALRIATDGKVFAYSGDTEWVDALTEVARGADLFVCEAYRDDEKVRYHLDYTTLMQRRPKLACKRLLITHMSQELLDRLPELAVEAASDGLEIEL